MRHPLHPALVHFPIAGWSLAVVADFASLLVGEAAWYWSAGLLTMACGMAVLAMLAGLLELSNVPEGKPMTDTYWHMGFMLVAFTLFGLRLVLGLDQMQPSAPDATSLILDAAGFAFLAAGGWYGGKLVYGHGIGRDQEKQQ